ncbi:MAG: 5-oxoprolinase subunit PxpB [Flavobacteriaceae bacterium]
MSPFKLTYKTFGNKAILIEWPLEISETILYDILKFKQRIKNHYSDFYDISTAYNSLTIYLNKELLNIDKEIDILNKIYLLGLDKNLSNNYIWHIPVCYDKTLAKDLSAFLKLKNLDLKQLISSHSAPLYTVYFLGFLPGFPYLGGLPKELHAPRKSQPELHIAKGAVGIGGQQTGIYPQDSPGGWHIIGKTPLSLFDVSNNPPCLLKAGDKIKFEPVSVTTFNEIKNQIVAHTYTFKKEALCLEYKS